MIKKLVEKYQIKFQFKKSACGRPRKDLNEEERNWLIVFSARSDATYTKPGRKDNLTLAKKMVSAATNNSCICSRIYKTFSISLTVPVKLMFLIAFIKALKNY